MIGSIQKPLTGRQRDALDYLQGYIAGARISPTVQEMGDALGVSKVTAREHVQALQEKGYVRCDKRKARSIQVLGDTKSVAISSAVEELDSIAGRLATLKQNGISRELLAIKQRLIAVNQ